jgi:RNA 2',3'-cyclic 3'-phosphodiesterase
VPVAPGTVHTGRMRCFVAIWPPPAVTDLLAALDRPADAGVRWTTPDQWHVTLVFLGEVAEPSVPGLVEGTQAAARRVDGPVEAELGPETEMLGRGVLYVPVRGIDALALAAREMVAALVDRVGERPFAGHLTLARARREGRIPAALRGTPVAATWTVNEICLVVSRLARSGARYETIASAPLGGFP